MNTALIFAWIWAAFIAISFWESSAEGRSAWGKRFLGWKIQVSHSISITRYHFFLFWVMVPLFLSLPLIIYGWDLRLAGILISAYFSGLVIEDFFWFVTNPVVKLSEMKTPFTDYYPWVKFNGKKIIPAYYVFSIVAAILSWYFLWRI